MTALSAFPLYFMVVMASRPNADITSVPPPLTPGGELCNNIDRVLSNPDITFGKAVVNTLLVAGVATISVVLFSQPGRVRLRQAALRRPAARCCVFVLLTMMVPIQLGLIPLYMLMVQAAPERHPAGGHRCRSWSPGSGCS